MSDVLWSDGTTYLAHFSVSVGVLTPPVVDEVKAVHRDFVRVHNAAARDVRGVQLPREPKILFPHGLAGLEVHDRGAFLALVGHSFVQRNFLVFGYEGGARCTEIMCVGLLFEPASVMNGAGACVCVCGGVHACAWYLYYGFFLL